MIKTSEATSLGLNTTRLTRFLKKSWKTCGYLLDKSHQPTLAYLAAGLAFTTLKGSAKTDKIASSVTFFSVV